MPATSDNSPLASDNSPLAVVTGASRGIGRATAERLVADGWRVANLSRTAPDTALAGCEWHAVDLGDQAALQDCLGEIVSHERVSGLVNNAAFDSASSLEDTCCKSLERSLVVNVTAPALCAQMVVPGMCDDGFGRIVNISSRAYLGKPRRTAYAASKGALTSMTKVWALEYADAGITVNTVVPGPVQTEMFERSNPPGSASTKSLVDAIPVGRIGQPEDIANAVSFFMDTRAGFVTGQSLFACGGLRLARGGA